MMMKIINVIVRTRNFLSRREQTKCIIIIITTTWDMSMFKMYEGSFLLVQLAWMCVIILFTFEGVMSIIILRSK